MCDECTWEYYHELIEEIIEYPEYKPHIERLETIYNSIEDNKHINEKQKEFMDELVGDQ